MSHGRWKADYDLFARAKRGEVVALRGMLDRLAPKGHALAWRLLSNEADAQDAVQDAFIKLLNGSPYAGAASLETYFYSIVSRLCFDRLRAGRLDVVEAADLAAMTDHDTPTPESAVAQGQSEQCVRRAIGRLTPRQRLAIAMWTYDDATSETIAEVIGISPNAAHQLLFRAKENLKNILEKNRA